MHAVRLTRRINFYGPSYLITQTFVTANLKTLPFIASRLPTRQTFSSSWKLHPRPQTVFSQVGYLEALLLLVNVLFFLLAKLVTTFPYTSSHHV